MIQSALDSQLAHIPRSLYRMGEEVAVKYTKDWSGISGPLPEVVFLPRTEQDAALILALCNELKHPVVTQGGLTGLSGGASPHSGEWVLSLERMRSIIELDVLSSTITVEAGVTLQEIHEAAAEHNLVFPLDMGSRGSCTVGGFTATNAGGTQVIQRGMVRNLVLGLDAVLADGTILSNRNKLLKNNAGYDLKQLFIGTEGTLGVITAATFRLFPSRPARHTALCGMHRFEDVISLLHLFQKKLPGLRGFELMWETYFQTVAPLTGQRDPFAAPFPFYALCEVEGADEQTTRTQFEQALEDAFERNLVQDAILSRNEQERSNLWKVRDGVSELFSSFNPVANFDIGIPITSMAQFALNVEQKLEAAFPQCQAFLFGHIGDGNLHLIASTGRQEDIHQIEDTVFALTRDASGTITAEHGIGVSKKEWLHYCRSKEEIETMKRLKRSFDPHNILNPGRIFDI